MQQVIFLKPVNNLWSFDTSSYQKILMFTEFQYSFAANACALFLGGFFVFYFLPSRTAQGSSEFFFNLLIVEIELYMLMLSMFFTVKLLQKCSLFWLKTNFLGKNHPVIQCSASSDYVCWVWSVTSDTNFSD